MLKHDANSELIYLKEFHKFYYNSHKNKNKNIDSLVSRGWVIYFFPILMCMQKDKRIHITNDGLHTQLFRNLCISSDHICLHHILFLCLPLAQHPLTKSLWKSDPYQV